MRARIFAFAIACIMVAPSADAQGNRGNSNGVPGNIASIQTVVDAVLAQIATLPNFTALQTQIRNDRGASHGQVNRGVAGLIDHRDDRGTGADEALAVARAIFDPRLIHDNSRAELREHLQRGIGGIDTDGQKPRAADLPQPRIKFRGGRRGDPDDRRVHGGMLHLPRRQS